MSKFNIELLPGASDGDRERAFQLCCSLDALLPVLVLRMEEELGVLLSADRRNLLAQVQTLGAEEVALRALAAVLTNAAERIGPRNARITFALHREDSTTDSRGCKASVDRMRRLLHEGVVTPV
jgi:hypothetical protein